MTAEEVYKERYGKERSDQGHGGFFACGVYGCNYIGKTYAHLSLHCALSRFCSHYDIPITSIRASDPMEATKHHSNSGKVGKALAQSTIMNTPISRWSLPPFCKTKWMTRKDRLSDQCCSTQCSHRQHPSTLKPDSGLEGRERNSVTASREFSNDQSQGRASRHG